jgi:hypothetical protein
MKLSRIHFGVISVCKCHIYLRVLRFFVLKCYTGTDTMLCCNGLFKQPTKAGHTTINTLNQLSPPPAIHWICILYLETVLKHETGVFHTPLWNKSTIII